LALLHRAPDLGGCLFRILPCHDASPGCAKTIFAAEVGSRFASFPRLAFGFPDVRRSPHKARTHSLRYAIERDSPAVSTSGPPTPARRAVHSPRQPAAEEEIRCLPAARR